MEDKGSFQLKGKLFTLTVLQLFHEDLDCLEQELKEHVAMAPGFFNHTPIVIDLHDMDSLNPEFNFKRLKEIICSSSMIPVGVKGADKSLKIKIETAGLAVLAETSSGNSNKAQEEERQNKTIAEKAEPQIEKVIEKVIETKTVEVAQQSMVVKQAIRSGRQIYAPNGDLIIIGSVSAGAEILADGNIHIYGTLRGRALAGIKGNTDATIFCYNLQAELVSIAGIYKLSDDMPGEYIGQFSQVSLVDEKLQFQHLN